MRTDKKKNRGRRLLRKYHKWPFVIINLFVLVFAVSGIVLNHRQFFSGSDVPRKYLLDEYQYNNWNNAAIKSACKIGHDSLLVYGNVGIWLSDSLFSSFRDFNKGFTDGIDNRKVYKVFCTNSGKLFAGTLKGLYSYNWDAGRWNFFNFSEEKTPVVDILEKDGWTSIKLFNWLKQHRFIASIEWPLFDLGSKLDNQTEVKWVFKAGKYISRKDLLRLIYASK